MGQIERDMKGNSNSKKGKKGKVELLQKIYKIAVDMGEVGNRCFLYVAFDFFNTSFKCTVR